MVFEENPKCKLKINLTAVIQEKLKFQEIAVMNTVFYKLPFLLRGYGRLMCY
jgi:hypothetical protein